MSSPDTFDARIYVSDIDRVELLERFISVCDV